tara:strand:+ start:67 stop:729 length:663 start_codon:yes stop_codon:yes gene_type:complete
MAQNITKRRGKSAIQTRLEMERRAENKNPGSRKAFAKGLGTTAELLAYGVPIGVVGNLSAKAATKLLTKYRNYQKVQNTPSISLYRGEPGYKTFKEMRKKRKNNKSFGAFFAQDKSRAKDYAENLFLPGGVSNKRFGVVKEIKVSPKELKALKNKEFKNISFGNTDDMFVGTVSPKLRRRAKVIPKAAGGVVKKRAVSKRVNVTRGDGIAKRGKTRGRMV